MIDLRKLFLVATALPLLAADQPKLSGSDTPAAKIARLEADRNAIAAEFQAARVAAARLEALQKAVQDADAKYRAAIEEEKVRSKLDPSCKLGEDSTWVCDKPVPPNAQADKKDKDNKPPENLEKEKKK